MSVRVRIETENGDAVQLRREGQAFQDLVSRTPDLSLSRPPDAAPGPGEKGGGVEFTTFLMALVTSGAVTGLIQVLQHYLSRTKTATVTFEAANGAKMTVSAQNLDPDKIEQTARRLNEIFRS